jgi:hypothetical protein
MSALEADLRMGLLLSYLLPTDPFLRWPGWAACLVFARCHWPACVV